jgi:hypothetical protein
MEDGTLGAKAPYPEVSRISTSYSFWLEHQEEGYHICKALPQRPSLDVASPLDGQEDPDSGKLDLASHWIIRKGGGRGRG